jgi:polyisoprenoid-binding protein YceI
MQTAVQRGLQPVNFLIDKAVSRFSVQAFATGLFASFGHDPKIEIRDYVGEIQCIPGTFEKAFLRVTVQAGGMEVLDEMKQDDRIKLEKEMYKNVLKIAEYPTAVYESKNVTVQRAASELMLVQVSGDLSFRGAVQQLPLEASVTIQGTNLRINGSFSLHQSDYGIKPVSFAGGGLRLKDELKFTFDLVARRQD